MCRLSIPRVQKEVVLKNLLRMKQYEMINSLIVSLVVSYNGNKEGPKVREYDIDTSFIIGIDSPEDMV